VPVCSGTLHQTKPLTLGTLHPALRGCRDCSATAITAGLVPTPVQTDHY